MAILDRVQMPGLSGIRVGRFFKNRVNTSCYVYRLGKTVVDCGPPNQWRYVKDFLDQVPLEQIVVTHHHEDHGGNVAKVQKYHAAPAFAHPNGIDPIQNGFPLPFYRRLVWGRPARQGNVTPWEAPILADGEALQPIWTPGHANDHYCILVPNRGWLFSGDLFISSRPKVTRKIEDPLLEMASLEKVLRHDFDMVLCAHRGPIKQGKKAIQSKLDRLRELKQAGLSLKAKGWSLKAITAELLGKEDLLLTMLSLGDFSKRNLISGLLRANMDENLVREQL